jgi:hypothetical protein
MADVTILNGKKWTTMNWNDRRRARHNPDDSLAARTGSMVLAAAVAAPIAVAADRALTGLKKADGSRRFSDNQVAGMVAGMGVAGAAISQVTDMAPRVGAAVGAAFAALAVRRAYDARSVVPTTPRQATQPTPRLPAPSPAPALPQGATPSPAQVTAAQTASPSTPAIPQGAPAPTPASSTEVTRSGAIIRRAGAAYDATYGQVSRSGAPVTSSQPDSMRAAPHIVSAMASNEEINHVSPQPSLRPAFVVGGRPSDQVKTFGPMQGVVRPSGAPMPLPAVPPASPYYGGFQAMPMPPVASMASSSDDGFDAQVNCHIVARPSGQRGGLTDADRMDMAMAMEARRQAEARLQAEQQAAAADEALAASVIDEALASIPLKPAGAPIADCGCGPTGALVVSRRAF